MNTRSMINRLAKQFPKRLAKKHHDHVGLMTGKLKEDSKKILLCLDLDEEVYPIIKDVMPDLIITHHPFIYGTKYRVFKYDEKKKALCEAIDKLDIPVYSMHTNFDEGKGGMNDSLAEALELKDIYAPSKEQMMRIGYLKEKMDIIEASKYIKNALNVSYGLLIQGNDKLIEKVGIIGGGGSRSFKIALEEGCDLYISGDIPHHVRRDVVTSKFNFLDLPHEIEKIFMPTMKKILLGFDSSLEIIIVDHEKLPKVI